MLHLIPPPLHRAGLRLAHAIRVRWWRLRKPALAGCRVLAIDGQGRVLLIRHSYGSGKWMLPGGGLARGEDPVAGATRELFEETGCRLTRPMVVERPTEDLHGARNTVHIVAGFTVDAPCADDREVIEARFFPAGSLPTPLAAGLAEALPRWITAAQAGAPARR